MKSHKAWCAEMDNRIRLEWGMLVICLRGDLGDFNWSGRTLKTPLSTWRNWNRPAPVLATF